MKRLWPFVVLPLLAGAVLLYFWLFRPRDDEEIRRAVLAHVRAEMTGAGKREGDDFTVGAIDILSKTDERAVAVVPVRMKPEGATLFFSVRRHGAEWKIESDLLEHFANYSSGDAFAKGVSERLARLEAERWRSATTVSVGGQRFQYRLVREGNDVVAKVRTAFAVDRTDGKQDRIDYVEDFRFRDGAWEPVIPGQVLRFRQP